MNGLNDKEVHMEFFWVMAHGSAAWNDPEAVLKALSIYRSRSVMVEMLCLALESGKGSGTASFDYDDVIQHLPFMYWSVKQGLSWVAADNIDQTELIVSGRTTNAFELFGVDLAEHDLAEELGFSLPKIRKCQNTNNYIW